MAQRPVTMYYCYIYIYSHCIQDLWRGNFRYWRMLLAPEMQTMRAVFTPSPVLLSISPLGKSSSATPQLETTQSMEKPQQKPFTVHGSASHRLSYLWTSCSAIDVVADYSCALLLVETRPMDLASHSRGTERSMTAPYDLRSLLSSATPSSAL